MRMLAALLALGACLFGAIMGVAALARGGQDSRCVADMATAIREMRGVHGEQVAGVGRTSDGRRLVVTLGRDDAWSVLIDDGGRVCLLAEGGSWRWSLITRGRNL